MAQAHLRKVELPLAGRLMELREFQRAAKGADETAPLATAQLVLSAGAAVRRYDYYRERWYDEVLVVEDGSIDMRRLQRGAPLLDSHASWSINDVLGVLEAPRIEAGRLTVDAKFSRRESVAGVVQDVSDGVIRNVSVGYARKRVVMNPPEAEGGIWIYRVTEWEVYEGSLVPIPADMDSQVMRAASGGPALDSKQRELRTFPCEFLEFKTSTRAAAQPQEKSAMTEAEKAALEAAEAATRAAADAAAKTARDEATKAERARVNGINELCARHKVPEIAQGFVDSGGTIDDVRAAVLAKIAAADKDAGGHRNVSAVQKIGDEIETRLAGMGDAILARVDAKHKLGDNGRQYRNLSLMEMGRDYLEARGLDTRGLSRMQLATQILTFRSPGMMTTSDFGSLLANVANKRLRQGYDENNPSFRAWARRAPNAPDFKQMSVVQLGAAPDLLQVNEHGEFTYGAMTDGKEVYSMLTYGRIVSFSRQSIINDDLRGFDRLVGAFGNSAARLENRTVYGILTTNAALSDALALFHATHTNLVTGATTNLGNAVNPLIAARAAMRKQKGLQNEELNLAPRYLIVPAELEQTAYQLTSPDFVPTTAGNINEFRRGGRTELVPVVESVLSANSATAWYLAADSGQVDTVEYCYLDGAEGPVIESEMGFEVDGISWKARLDFAAKAIDFRGMYKSAGA